MSLVSSPVNGLNLEGSALALWNEFLSGFFDGGTHDIGPQKAVQFPTAELRFQEASQVQPLPAVGISVVWISPSRVTTYWDTLTQAEIAGLPTGSVPNVRQQRAKCHSAFIFLIRATTDTGVDNSQKQVQTAASLLFGLLSNPGATILLGEKGIHHLRPSPPRMAWTGDGAPTADLGYRLRVLSCAALLKWPIVSQSA